MAEQQALATCEQTASKVSIAPLGERFSMGRAIELKHHGLLYRDEY